MRANLLLSSTPESRKRKKASANRMIELKLMQNSEYSKPNEGFRVSGFRVSAVITITIVSNILIARCLTRLNIPAMSKY